MTINWLTTVKNYGGKRPSKVVDFNALDADRVTTKTIKLLFICYHPNLYKKNILHFQIIIYRFHVLQTFGNPYQFSRC